MKDWWLKLGCFLTGHNYRIIKNSSEASAKSVKKYLSAIIIVSLLWGFIGYVFVQRYVHATTLQSSIVAFVLVIIVVQIERQIILTTSKNSLGKSFRIVIAIVMAIIGSVIIDQKIFNDDIEKLKISNVQEQVSKVLLSRTALLDNEILDLDSLIDKKEVERTTLIGEVTEKPFVKGSTSVRKTHPIRIKDRNGNESDTLITKTDLTIIDIANPKAELIPKVDQQIKELREQRSVKQNAKITIREDLEKELRAKTGFLDELVILISILLSHWVAFFVWFCLFLFFFSIELFVLVNKFGDTKSDYDMIILHQMNTKIKMIEKLAE